MKTESELTQELKNHDENEVCRICHEQFLYLGSHVWHKHKLKSQKYKEMFGLPHKFMLISDSVRDKKSKRFNERREYYMKNIEGTEHRFAKGSQKTRYRSKAEMKKVTERINNVNTNLKLECCPVCNQHYEHLDSHLFNKHKLLRVSAFNTKNK
jgi:hypothetical protein